MSGIIHHTNKQVNKELNKWLVFCLVAVGIFMSTLDGSIVNIALSAIMQDLQSPLNVIEWVMMIYLLTVSSLLLSFGRLSDIRGRRWVYSRGLIVFTLGSFLCGLANHAFWLIAARAFQGVGAAMIMACTPALITDTFPISERGKALGMVGAVVASGLTVGPALGGLILHYFPWQTIFYINIPIGLSAAVIVARMLKGHKSDTGRKEPFDKAGAVWLAVSLSSFLLAVSHGNIWGYGSFKTLILFGIFLIAVLFLIRIEPRNPHPIIEPSILKIRLFIFPIISAVILFIGLFTLIFLMPFFLMNPCGFSVSQAGTLMVTPFLFLFIFSPISGALSDRIGSRFLCTFGMGILSLALFLLSRLNPTSEHLTIAWRMGLAGLGTAFFISPNSSVSMSSVPKNYMGVAAGTVATARNLGMVIGIAMAATVFNSVYQRFSGGQPFKVYNPELESVFMTAFRYAMLSGCGMTCIGMAIAFLRGAHPNPKIGITHS